MGKYVNPSPSAGFLSNLFGIGARQTKGGFQLDPGATRRGEFPYATPIFTPDAAGQIQDYISLSGSNPYTAALGRINAGAGFDALPDEIYQPYQQAIGTLDDLIGRGRPLLDALMATGLPVDIGSVVNAAQSRYRNDILPTAAEMYNPAQGTAFQNIAAREAQLLADELGKLDYESQEAARGRQERALSVGAPALSGLTAARLALPGAAISEAQNISELTDPGGRLLASLLSILGYSQQPSEFIRTGSAVRPSAGGGGGSGTGDIMSSVSSLVGIVGALAGAACWVADELFGPMDVRTWLARSWVLAHPEHPFVQRYMAEGREWAAWLHENPWAKPVVAPAWEWMAQQALH